MRQIKKNEYYIYNLEQANWMLKQGCLPEEVGKGMKGDIYLKFPRIPEIEEVVDIWRLRKRTDKTNRE
jgi:hypothetical protein